MQTLAPACMQSGLVQLQLLCLLHASSESRLVQAITQNVKYLLFRKQVPLGACICIYIYKESCSGPVQVLNLEGLLQCWGTSGRLCNSWAGRPCSGPLATRLVCWRDLVMFRPCSGLALVMFRPCSGPAQEGSFIYLCWTIWQVAQRRRMIRWPQAWQLHACIHASIHYMERPYLHHVPNC